jgi:hypothetical protein
MARINVSFAPLVMKWIPQMLINISDENGRGPAEMVVAGSSYHAHMILVYKHEEQAWNSAPANSI